MDTQSIISAAKELGIGIFSVGVVGYILYQVILSLREEHKENQAWFKEYVNNNNHKMTDLVGECSKNIAQNTAITEIHTKTLERLLNKMD